MENSNTFVVVFSLTQKISLNMYNRLDAKRGITNINDFTDTNWLPIGKSGADVFAVDIMFALLSKES